MGGGVGGDPARRVRDLLALRRHEQARGLAVAALAQRPDDAELMLLLGWAQLGLDDLAAAARTARRAAALAPHDDEAHRLLAVALTRSDDQWHEAERPARAAVRLGPHHAPNHEALAWALLRNGWDLQGWEVARRALTLAPFDPDTHVLMAEAHQQMGKTSDAVASLREALRLDPTHAPALNNLALLEASQRRPGRLIAGLTRAATLDHRLAEPRENLDGVTLLLMFWAAACAVVVLPLVAALARAAGAPLLAPLLVVTAIVVAAVLWLRLPAAFRRSRRSRVRAGFGQPWMFATLLLATVLGLLFTAASGLVGAGTADLWRLWWFGAVVAGLLVRVAVWLDGQRS